MRKNVLNYLRVSMSQGVEPARQSGKKRGVDLLIFYR